jgi:NAD(P)H-dependent FMN reductase
MSEPLNVLAVIGSLHAESATRAVIRLAADKLRADGCTIDILDLSAEPLAMLNPASSYTAPGYVALKSRVEKADVILLGTPDYHGSISGALKNFLDHFWHEFAGKLFASIVASHEKGLTVADQIRTIARQCYAWALPYNVAFVDKTDFKDGQVATDAFRDRLAMLIRDTRVYGKILADQRHADLTCTDHCFMSKHRK